MIPIRDLFEAHLTVKDLQRSMSFFGAALGLELAQVFPQKGRVLLDRASRRFHARSVGGGDGATAVEPASRLQGRS